jgi:SH3-like domain-containing protein
MKRVILTIFATLLFVSLVISGTAEGADVILGPGGIYNPDGEDTSDIIVGPGGTYNPDDEPEIIVGPGGIYNPDDEPEIIYPAIHVYMYVKTNGGHLNVRSRPNSDAQIIGQLAYGEQILVTGLSDYSSWAKVLYGSQDGYVQKSYLSNSQPIPEPTATPYYPPYPTVPPYYPTDPPYYPTTPPYYPTTPPYYPETTITDLNAVFNNMVIDINAPFKVTTHPVQSGEYVPLYWAPNQDASVLRYCNEGESFTVIAHTNEWLLVRDDTYGFSGFLMRVMAY